MPTIGSGVFYPGGQLAFPRSYIWGFDVRIDIPGVQDGRFFRFTSGLPGAQTFTIAWKENVFDWSSNRYTLDYVIEQSFYQNAGDSTEHPMSYGLAYFAATDTGRSNLIFFPFNLPFIDDHFFPLPAASAGYWRPSFP